MSTIDPTRIAVALDPRTRMIEGVAEHVMTPFACPLISQITDDLWTGGCLDGLSLPAGIEHVVSLYKWERYVPTSSVQSFLEVTMYDSEDQSFAQVERLARWVNECRADGPTLVHCQAGLNRSGLIAAAALIAGGTEPVDAIALLREKRSPAVLCNPSFERWLMGLR